MYSGSIPTVEVYNANVSGLFSLPPMLATSPVVDPMALTHSHITAVTTCVSNTPLESTAVHEGKKYIHCAHAQ